MEWHRANYVISTDKAKLNFRAIHDFLKNSYWAKEIPFGIMRKSIDHSLCFGVYDAAAQVGFARVITDSATFAYLADVFILESHRGRGLSKWLMQCIMEHPELQDLRRWMLATKDAHGLYAQYGFTPLKNPERIMEFHHPEVYVKMRTAKGLAAE